MKRVIYLTLLLFVLLSFNKKQEFNLVKTKSGLLVDKTEITNLNWKEYLSWIEKKHGEKSPEYQQALPDTLVWRENNGNSEPYVEYYFRHPAYAAYPIVGISYNQALAYCKWRSDRVNEKIYIQNNKIATNELPLKNIPVVYTFRLPSKQEWLSFSDVDIDKKFQKRIIKKHPNRYSIISEKMVFGNFITNLIDDANKTGTLKNNADITTAVGSYYPNIYGIYNTFGNIAEMTDKKGVAMGGHWKENLDNFKIEKEYNYTKPTCWLGFRCVAEKNNTP